MALSPIVRRARPPGMPILGRWSHPAAHITLRAASAAE